MSFINRIESSANVHLRYLGIDCWPIVRNTFMSIETHGVINRTKNRTPQVYFRALLDFIYLLFRADSVYALILSDYKYQVNLNGKSYLQDASVIQELMTDDGKKCHILTQNVSENSKDANHSHSLLFLTAISVVFSKLLMVLDFNKKIVIRYIHNIFSSESLGSFVFDTKRTTKQIKRNIYFIIVASFLFQLFLKRTRPKKCFIVCYYSCIGMALCAACRRLGIETVDLQHGVSGKNMRAYGQWNSMSSEGLNTLPHTFFCWAPTDVAAIKHWSANNENHNAVLTGNIWRQYLVEKGQFQVHLPDEQKLADEVSGYQKILLYTARNNKLPKLILDFLKQAPQEYFFMIRMHPDTPAEEIEIMSKKLKLLRSSYSILNATRARIHVVVQMADMHITEWSAVVYDAFFEYTASIVITESGKDYFSDFISQGITFYCDDIKCMLEKVEGVSKKEKYNVEFLSLSELRNIL